MNDGVVCWWRKQLRFIAFLKSAYVRSQEELDRMANQMTVGVATQVPLISNQSNYDSILYCNLKFLSKKREIKMYNIYYIFYLITSLVVYYKHYFLFFLSYMKLLSSDFVILSLNYRIIITNLSYCKILYTIHLWRRHVSVIVLLLI